MSAGECLKGCTGECQKCRPRPWHEEHGVDERIYFRDMLRAARYAALADSEGFEALCFAFEALGKRLYTETGNGLKDYKPVLKRLARSSVVLSVVAPEHPHYFRSFDALFEIVKAARNDAMHSGAFARHATQAGIELCIALEDAIMATDTPQITDCCASQACTKVNSLMVRSPVVLQSWQPLAYARQLMLTHSFSNLPVFIGKHWYLLSERSMARAAQSACGNQALKTLLTKTVEQALTLKLFDSDQPFLHEVNPIAPDTCVRTLLGPGSGSRDPGLWLISDHEGHLSGVLSIFELM